MPRPTDEELGEAPTEGGTYKTPLALYLEMNGISQNAFARASGFSFQSVMDWVRGARMPTLAAAYEIERISKGVVPMEAWLASPSNKSMLSRIRGRQPEEIRYRKPVLKAGGFAREEKVGDPLPDSKAAGKRRAQLLESEESEDEASGSEDNGQEG